MKITIGELLDGYATLTAIINDKRPLPQKGKYRIGRMHTALATEVKQANEQHDELVKKYGAESFEQGPDGQPTEPLVSTGWRVTQQNLAAFGDEWGAIRGESIEVVVEPIPLDQLCFANDETGLIEAHEFMALGALVSE